MIIGGEQRLNCQELQVPYFNIETMKTTLNSKNTKIQHLPEIRDEEGRIESGHCNI